MKRLILLAAFSVALVSGASKTQCDENLMFDCGNCTTLIICNPLSAAIVLSLPCPATTPYCNGGQCVSTASTTCAATANASPLCPENGSPGYYPNPKNCYKYNYCDENKQATSISCPGNYVYDRLNGGCKVKASNADCPTVACSYYNNKYLPYPPDNTLYWYCSGSITQLLQCSTGQEFDASLRVCTSDVCTTNGLIPYSGDTSKYYMCIKLANGKYVKYLQQCASGLVFNGVYCGSVLTSTASTVATTLSTSVASTESTTQSTTVTSTELTTDSTTASTTPSTTASSSESTTASTTASTTPSTTPTTSSTTASSTTASTTPSSTTASTTPSTTASTTQSTTASTTQSTTASTTLSTTASTTPSTTNESTTASTTPSTTTASTTPSSTTASTSESTTASTTVTTSESTTALTTEPPVDSTTTDDSTASTPESSG